MRKLCLALVWSIGLLPPAAEAAHTKPAAEAAHTKSAAEAAHTKSAAAGQSSQDTKAALLAAQAAAASHRQAAAAARAKTRADAAQAALLAEAQIEAAAKLRRLETQTGNAAASYAQLQATQQQANQALSQNAAELSRLLPVMQRLTGQPAATLLANPAPPVESIRGVLIVAGIAAQIQRSAAAMQAQAQTAQRLLGQMSAQQVMLLHAVATQQKAEDALTAQIAAAQQAETADRDEAAQQAAAALAANANLRDLRSMIANLQANPQPAPDFAALTIPHGGAPVAGKVTEAFGDPTIAGPAIGITYRAAPGARVVAPCGGPVQFADHFQSYGLLVIIDCGQNYLFVLSGMSHLDVIAGQAVARGQPVGEMLGFDPKNPARQPELYMELRQNGTPVNPAGWVATGG